MAVHPLARCLALALLAWGSREAAANETAEEGTTPDAEHVARQLVNPVSNLVSLPFQLNVNVGAGAREDHSYVLNIQPVLPIELGGDWLLVTRHILPVLNQPADDAGVRVTGVGDLLSSFFLSPRLPPWLNGGVGPAVSLPVASKEALGTSKLSVGPTAVALVNSGQWIFALLANHLWSVAGDRERSAVNQTFLQPFCTRMLTGGYTITLSSETVANWKAAADETWLVPAILTASKTFTVSQQMMSFGVGGRYNLVRPTGAPTWGVRLVYTLVFPVKPMPMPAR